MDDKMKASKSPATKTRPSQTLKKQVADAVAWLKAHGSDRRRDEMGPRFGVYSDTAFGVSMVDTKALAKQLGRNHVLAAALWETGLYDARMLASLVDEPDMVTPAQMDRWCRDFDNWGICDTVCFCLFDRTPHAYGKVAQWAKRRDEFVRRGAFALLASLALHDKKAANDTFMLFFPLIESAADDDRNFVKKGVNWALRAIGKRNPQLRAGAIEVAERLAASPIASARWVGKDALRDLAKTRTTKPAKGAKA
ncbi:MAG TPA: DNA alkylation repair protein [Blastocatellia bacterium]|nr:DNA alkylation repair protein [Blastocatellia bacterium]